MCYCVYGTLSPFKSDPSGPDGLYVSGGPVGPFGTLSPSNSGSAILVDPGGVFPLSDPPPGGTLPPGEEGLPSCTDGVGTPTVVDMVGMDVLSIENDLFADGYGDTEMIAIEGYRCEIVDGMRVYYGDSPCNSDESDWEDPYDVAGRQYVDDYNFDVPDGMDLMVFERGGGRLDQGGWI